MEAVSKMRAVRFTIELEQEDDGRWIADLIELPGVMAYGASKEEALIKVQALAYRVLADKTEKERKPQEGVRFAFA